MTLVGGGGRIKRKKNWKIKKTKNGRRGGGEEIVQEFTSKEHAGELNENGKSCTSRTKRMNQASKDAMKNNNNKK